MDHVGANQLTATREGRIQHQGENVVVDLADPLEISFERLEGIDRLLFVVHKVDLLFESAFEPFLVRSLASLGYLQVKGTLENESFQGVNEVDDCDCSHFSPPQKQLDFGVLLNQILYNVTQIN